jgi:hypothetical protein
MRVKSLTIFKSYLFFRDRIGRRVAACQWLCAAIIFFFCLFLTFRVNLSLWQSDSRQIKITWSLAIWKSKHCVLLRIYLAINDIFIYLHNIMFLWNFELFLLFEFELSVDNIINV